MVLIIYDNNYQLQAMLKKLRQKIPPEADFPIFRLSNLKLRCAASIGRARN
jgi:hypothetical protein